MMESESWLSNLGHKGLVTKWNFWASKKTEVQRMLYLASKEIVWSRFHLKRNDTTLAIMRYLGSKVKMRLGSSIHNMWKYFTHCNGLCKYSVLMFLNSWALNLSEGKISLSLNITTSCVPLNHSTFLVFPSLMEIFLALPHDYLETQMDVWKCFWRAYDLRRYSVAFELVGQGLLESKK